MKFISKILRKLQKSRQNTQQLKDIKILLADDVQEIREFIRIILDKAGAVLTACASGQDAIDKAKTNKYDMILLDINMPEIDGCEIARSIRKNSVNRQTPLIALTASGLLDLGNKHTEAGFDDYIEKPVRPESLVRKVHQRLLREKQVEAAKKGEQIVSSYKDDPDYKKTIESFISDLPERLKDIQTDFDKGDMKDLATKLHSLKGMGGLAGFPVISDKAGEIEDKLHHEDFDKQIQKISQSVNELILLCRNTKLKKK